jgi:hypothetical protein
MNVFIEKQDMEKIYSGGSYLKVGLKSSNRALKKQRNTERNTTGNNRSYL